MEVLSRRELEVLQLVALGASNSQIAETLALSIHTVKKHLVHLLLKLRVESRSEAAHLYRESITPASRQPDTTTAQAQSLEDLTTREWDVLSRIASGANNQRIAAELALSLNTVKRHTTSIYSKLGVKSRVRAAALLYASSHGGSHASAQADAA